MRFPIVTTILTLTTITLYFFAGAIPEQLIWYSDDQQQPWQWITGHFAHISVDHLLWNSIALAVLGTIIEQTSRKILLASLALGIFSIRLVFSLQVFRFETSECGNTGTSDDKNSHRNELRRLTGFRFAMATSARSALCGLIDWDYRRDVVR